MNWRFDKLSIRITASLWLMGLCAQAQVQVGLNSPKIRWQHIKTENFEVIFPASRESDAMRVANVLDYITSHEELTIGPAASKIPFILQNQTVIPNGFVTLAPWRSELLLNPPQFQFAGAVSWMDLLTIHEYRHAQQINHARKGIVGKIARGLFGQSGWAFNYGSTQPRWFLEGDAVYAETVYTNGGRGRVGDFEKEYRALRLSGLKYNYEKASFWSYKDFVPNHYHLGYFMTTHARRKFGSDVWDRVLQQTYAKPGLYRFSKALKKETGFSTKHLYFATMQELDSIWNAYDEKISATSGNLKTTAVKKVYTNYRFPNYLGDNSLLVQKSSLREIRTIYKVEQGKEIKLFRPGIGLADHYSVGGDKMVWSEVRFHPRWINHDYSVIMLYDLKTGAKQKITYKSKLQVPALSHDGKRIAAIEVTPKGTNELVVLETATGKEFIRFDHDPESFISFPRWQDDDLTIIVAVRNLKGNFLRAYDLENREVRDLIIPISSTIDRIFPKGKHVYFSSSKTGIQNIFALDTSTSEIFQITDSRFGAFDPSVSNDGKKLAYSEYTAMGFEVRELDLKDALWQQTTISIARGSDYFQPLMSQEIGDITGRIPSKQFPVQPFKYHTRGLFNIHTWFPFVTTEEFGVGILSNNIMSSLALTGQFTYNTNEDSWKTIAQVSYGAFFPVLDLDITTGERQTDNLVSTTDTLSIIGYGGGWKEHSFGAAIRFPLNLSHGNYSTNLTLAPGYRHYVVDYFDGITDRVRNENFGSLDIDLNFSRFQSAALQNILPRWGQSLDINYQRTVGQSENRGEIFTINAALVFPGFSYNHSLFFTGGYQEEDIVDAYRFEDLFTSARGYGSRAFETVYRVSSNYTLPVWYPDAALGSLAYFKRIRSNFFYDYSEGRLLGFSTQMRSYGLEIITDFRLVRLLDVGVGVRLGRQVDRNRNFIEFIISNIQF